MAESQTVQNCPQPLAFILKQSRLNLQSNRTKNRQCFLYNILFAICFLPPRLVKFGKQERAKKRQIIHIDAGHGTSVTHFMQNSLIDHQRVVCCHFLFCGKHEKLKNFFCSHYITTTSR